MSAAQVNMTANQGAPLVETYTYYNEDGVTLIDLTSLTARMDIRSAYSGDVLIAATSANGKITLGGALGTIAITLSGADLAALPVPDGPMNPAYADFLYDIELVDAGAVPVDKPMFGRIRVFREVTHT